MTRQIMILAATVLAVISIGVLTLFLMIYAAWFEGSESVVFPGSGLVVATPFLLVFLAVIELFISVILFLIVRRMRK